MQNDRATLEQRDYDLVLPSLSAFLSLGFAFMTARAAAVGTAGASRVSSESYRVHPRVIDEQRSAFDLIDGHWD
jgi:hypothetical protein